MSTCWPCAHPAAGSASPSTVPDPVGVCSLCNTLACSPHSGIAGTGKLICAFCAAFKGLTLKTFPLGPGSGGGKGPGGGVGVSGGSSGGDDAGQYLAEPKLPDDEIAFGSLAEALYVLPSLYRQGQRFRLPRDMYPDRLIKDARRSWRALYGTELTSASLDSELAMAAVGLVLWTVGVPADHEVSADEENMPWLVRIPLLRVAVANRERAMPV
jgi:hypothetical protein